MDEAARREHALLVEDEPDSPGVLVDGLLAAAALGPARRRALGPVDPGQAPVRDALAGLRLQPLALLERRRRRLERLEEGLGALKAPQSRWNQCFVSPSANGLGRLSPKRSSCAAIFSPQPRHLARPVAAGSIVCGMVVAFRSRGTRVSLAGVARALSRAERLLGLHWME